MAIAASCGSLNVLTLGLPTRAAVPDAKGALPKQMFIGRGAVSAKTKQRFATDIESISMLAILRPATTGLAESRRFPEILGAGTACAERSGGAGGGDRPYRPPNGRAASCSCACATAGRCRTPKPGSRSHPTPNSVPFAVPAERAGQTGGIRRSPGACRSMASGRRSRLTVYGTTMEELWDSLCAQTIADDIDGSDIDARIAARERATFLESEYAKAKAAHARARTTEQRNAAYGKMLAIRKELAQLKV